MREENKYSLPYYTKKKKKITTDTSSPVGRKQYSNFKITVEEPEIKILESILKVLTESNEDQIIKSIIDSILEKYNDNPFKPIILNKHTSDLLHQIFIPSWE